VTRLELLVLDYDETAVENTVDFYEAYCEALKIHGKKCVSFDRFIALLSTDELGEEIPVGADEVGFWRVFRRVYGSRHSTLRRGLRELLIAVKTLNVKVVVISGRETPPYHIEFDLRKHGISEFVDGVYTLYNLLLVGEREEFLFDKSPLIRYAKRKHGISGEVICIGDYVTDYYSCRKAGGVFVGIASVSERGESLKKAGVEFLVKDFYEALLCLHYLGLLRG